MSGLTSREDLKRSIGHFSNGSLVAPGGRLMVSFDVDFQVTPDQLMMLNAMRSGIRFCEAIHPSKMSKRTILLQFSQGRSQNEVIAIAIAYRNKVNTHLERIDSQTPAPSAPTKRGSADKGDIRPKPSRVIFSGPPSTS